MPPKERAAVAERERGSAHSRGYDRTWEKLRDVIRQRDPLCVFCLAAGRVTATQEIDHIIPIALAPERRLDPDNLRGLCTPCHSAHTARQQAALRLPRAR